MMPHENAAHPGGNQVNGTEKRETLDDQVSALSLAAYGKNSKGEGFTQVPNGVLELIFGKQLSGPARDCLGFLARQLNGYHKDREKLSLGEFIDGNCWSSGTGLARSSVRYGLDELRKAGIIGSRSKGSGRGTKTTYWIRPKCEWLLDKPAMSSERGAVEQSTSLQPLSRETAQPEADTDANSRVTNALPHNGSRLLPIPSRNGSRRLPPINKGREKENNEKETAAVAAAPAATSSRTSLKKEGRRQDQHGEDVIDVLMAVFIEEFGTEPRTDSQERRWRHSLRELDEAGVTPDELHVLCAHIIDAWTGAYKREPYTISAHLGELRDEIAEEAEAEDELAAIDRYFAAKQAEDARRRNGANGQLAMAVAGG